MANEADAAAVAPRDRHEAPKPVASGPPTHVDVLGWQRQIDRCFRDFPIEPFRLARAAGPAKK